MANEEKIPKRTILKNKEKQFRHTKTEDDNKNENKKEEPDYTVGPEQRIAELDETMKIINKYMPKDEEPDPDENKDRMLEMAIEREKQKAASLKKQRNARSRLNSAAFEDEFGSKGIGKAVSVTKVGLAKKPDAVKSKSVSTKPKKKPEPKVPVEPEEQNLSKTALATRFQELRPKKSEDKLKPKKEVSKKSVQSEATQSEKPQTAKGNRAKESRSKSAKAPQKEKESATPKKETSPKNEKDSDEKEEGGNEKNENVETAIESPKKRPKSTVKAEKARSRSLGPHKGPKVPDYIESDMSVKGFKRDSVMKELALKAKKMFDDLEDDFEFEKTLKPKPKVQSSKKAPKKPKPISSGKLKLAKKVSPPEIEKSPIDSIDHLIAEEEKKESKNNLSAFFNETISIETKKKSKSSSVTSLHDEMEKVKKATIKNLNKKSLTALYDLIADITEGKEKKPTSVVKKQSTKTPESKKSVADTNMNKKEVGKVSKVPSKVISFKNFDTIVKKKKSTSAIKIQPSNHRQLGFTPVSPRPAIPSKKTTLRPPLDQPKRLRAPMIAKSGFEAIPFRKHKVFSKIFLKNINTIQRSYLHDMHMNMFATQERLEREVDELCENLKKTPENEIEFREKVDKLKGIFEKEKEIITLQRELKQRYGSKYMSTLKEQEWPILNGFNAHFGQIAQFAKEINGKLTFYCPTCKVTCSDEMKFRTHLEGASHVLKAYKEIKAKQPLYHCESCQEVITGTTKLMCHVGSKLHMKNLHVHAKPKKDNIVSK